MKKVKYFAVLITGTAIIAVASCKKDRPATVTPPPSEETATAVDNAYSEHAASDVMEIAAQSSDGSAQLGTYRPAGSDQIAGTSCATIVRDSVNKKITITFGSGSCLDGHIRTGSITLDYSNSPAGANYFRDPNFSCVITSNNYAVDGYQINILSNTIQNTTTPQFNPKTTNLTWSVNAHFTIIKPTGASIDYSCSRVKTLLNTSNTSVYPGAGQPINWSLASVGVTGTASGMTTSGIVYSSRISSMLIRDFGACSVGGVHPIIQGVLYFTPAGHPARILDYGTGTCDRYGTLTINGVSTTIVVD